MHLAKKTAIAVRAEITGTIFKRRARDGLPSVIGCYSTTTITTTITKTKFHSEVFKVKLVGTHATKDIQNYSRYQEFDLCSALLTLF